MQILKKNSLLLNPIAEMESVYVVVELDGVALPAPGSNLKLKGLHTPEPRLELDDGTILIGEFQETIGTQLVFAEHREEEGEGKGKVVELRCHTDKKIRFHRTTR